MGRKKPIDLRTPREIKRDENCAYIAKRFRELYPYAPNPTRVFKTISSEIDLDATCVRAWCVKMGLFIPGTGQGNSKGYQVVL